MTTRHSAACAAWAMFALLAASLFLIGCTATLGFTGRDGVTVGLSVSRPDNKTL